MKRYPDALKSGNATEEELAAQSPYALITAREGSGYTTECGVVIPLTVYETRLTFGEIAFVRFTPRYGEDKRTCDGLSYQLQKVGVALTKETRARLIRTANRRIYADITWWLLSRANGSHKLN